MSFASSGDSFLDVCMCTWKGEADLLSGEPRLFVSRVFGTPGNSELTNKVQSTE